MSRKTEVIISFILMVSIVSSAFYVTDGMKNIKRIYIYLKCILGVSCDLQDYNDGNKNGVDDRDEFKKFL